MPNSFLKFEESNLRFIFDDAQWSVIKYDDHRNHANIKIKEHKAIDFLALYNANTIVLFEIKSFRKHRLDPETQLRMANGAEELTTEIAQKVRDSIAGIIGAGRNSDSVEHIKWRQISEKLIKAKTQVYVIAWVEEDMPNGYRKERYQAKSTVNMDKLKNKLKWLNVKVSVSNIDNMPQFDGFSVERLAESDL
jgi:hypothetical protein